MHYATMATLALAALNIGEAVAGPAHAHMHQKKDVDYVAAYWRGIAQEKAAAASSVKPASQPAPSASASTSSSSSSDSGLLGGIVGLSNKLAKFGESSLAPGQAPTEGDAAINNVGKPYGSNIIKVPSRQGYDFTNEFKNTQKVPITVNIWNKVGQDGQPFSGITAAPKVTALTFVLAPGASQIVAFMDNTQAAWAQATTKVNPVSGQFDTTIGEGNFKSTGSGYDVSIIPNSANSYNYDTSITSTEAPACTSNQQNYWVTAAKWIGGSNGSCYIAQKTATLTTILGGTI